MGQALKDMLSRLNICSKESVVRQYDHEVQGGSVVKPLVGVGNDGPSDAAVIRPILDSFEGVVVANGICPRYSDIDTYHMAACAIDEAIRNAIAVGEPSTVWRGWITSAGVTRSSRKRLPTVSTNWPSLSGQTRPSTTIRQPMVCPASPEKTA